MSLLISQPVQRPAEKVTSTVARAGKAVVGLTRERLSWPMTDSIPTGACTACSADRWLNALAESRPMPLLARSAAVTPSSTVPVDDGQ
jgi:hypothetical protein